MASVRSIAKSAGVSVATVSRTLNNQPDVSEETRDRVRAAATKLGYDAGARRRKSALVGLAYPGQPVNPEFGGFDAAIVSGVTRGVNAARFDVALLNVARDKKPGESYTAFFRRKGIAGVVLRSFADSRHLCEEIAEEGFPHVVVADRFEHPEVNYVHNDSSADTARAIEHLASMGHERVGLCIHMVADSDHADRRRAFEAGVKEHGLDDDPQLRVEVIADMNGGVTAINQLMSLAQPPTAVLCTDPLSSLGVLRRCLEMGIRVPDELSVVGFDDSGVRAMAYPVYTSVCQDAIKLGEDAAAWLTRSLVGDAEPTLRLTRPTFFEVNHTTAPPPRVPVRVLPGGRRVPAPA